MIATLISNDNVKDFQVFFPEDVHSLNDVSFGAVDEETDTACGAVTAEVISPYLLSITYIYVAEDYRRKGAGRALVEALLEFCQISKFSALICEHRENYDENDALVSAFLKGCRFDCLDYSRNFTYSITVGDINVKKKSIRGKVIPLKKVSEDSWKKYSNRIKMLEEKDKSGYITELDDIHHYDKEFSFLYLDDQKDIVGSLLFKPDPNGLFINNLHGFGNDASKIIYSLFQTMEDVIKSSVSQDKKIFVNAASDQILHSIELITDTHLTPIWSNVVDAYFI